MRSTRTRPEEGTNPTASERLAELKHCLSTIDALEKELFAKSGKSRTATFTVGSAEEARITNQVAYEIGHTLRAGDDQSAIAWMQSGWPDPAMFGEHLESYRLPGKLALPTPRHAATRTDRDEAAPIHGVEGAADSLVDRPLLSESEIWRLAEGFERQLSEELDCSFRLSGQLADGAAQSWLLNGHGVSAFQRSRTTSLRLNLTTGGTQISTYVGSCGAAELRPKQVAQRLIDRVAIGRKARGLARPAAVALLAPQVAGTLLANVASHFLRPDSEISVSEALSICDDPATALGVARHHTDGEGVATKAVQLVERGEWCGWLKPWDSDDSSTNATGCRYRHSWRDLPVHRCSNLVVTASNAGPAELLSGIESGVYIVASDQVAQRQNETLELPAVGFEVKAGATVQPIITVLRLTLQDVLARVVAVGRDTEVMVPVGPVASVIVPSTLYEDVELLEP